MKTTRILLPLKVGLSVLVLSFAFWGCEADELDEPRPNVRPETFISELSAGVETRVSWYGTDSDGRIESFEYRWDGGTWVETTELSEIFPTAAGTDYDDFGFADLTEEHTFEVRATDNAGGTDQSPATATVSAVTVAPETQINEGPEFGGTYGPDVLFRWSGVDADGSIAGFEYTMDDPSSWTYKDAEAGDVGEQLFLGLAPGAHIFYVRSVDDLGATDLTPAQVPFTVKTGDTPLLTSTSPIVDGGGWFAAVSVAFSWTIDVEYYGGQLPHGYSTYALDDSTGYSAAGANMQYSWRPSLSHSIDGADIAPGDHTFYVKVRDTQGSVEKFSVGFSAAGFDPTSGILVVNGVSPVYEEEITEAYDSSAYWGGLDVDFWDLFGTGSTPSISTMPVSAANAVGDGPYDYIGGGGPTTPDVLKNYSSVIWVANAYMGDLEDWQVSPVYPYLLAGGNLILTTRNGADFFTPELTSYLEISWRAAETATVYPTITTVLRDLVPFSSYRSGGVSSTGHFSMGAFTNNAALSHYHDDLPFPDGWYHNSAGTSTLLFYNDTDWSYVRGMSAWAHPNLVLGANEEPTFPTTGDAAKGNFVYIAGRNYGLNRVNLGFNINYIVTNFFGE